MKLPFFKRRPRPGWTTNDPNVSVPSGMLLMSPEESERLYQRYYLRTNALIDHLQATCDGGADEMAVGFLFAHQAILSYMHSNPHSERDLSEPLNAVYALFLTAAKSREKELEAAGLR